VRDEVLNMYLPSVLVATVRRTVDTAVVTTNKLLDSVLPQYLTLVIITTSRWTVAFFNGVRTVVACPSHYSIARIATMETLGSRSLLYFPESRLGPEVK